MRSLDCGTKRRTIERTKLAIIQCDIRRGRNDDQKRALARALIDVVAERCGETDDEILFVLREAPGFNFVEGGEHCPDYVAGPNGEDLAAAEHLRQQALKADDGSAGGGS
jgi:phenylpyruvate tautomerase PptA (4-oxalocrotonate tautomerase family)